jgi:SDR family mycofactocin-dependent oxidoreductase
VSLAGQVAFITGAARGQGRSHAIRLARDGAAVIAVDVCADIPSVRYHLGTAEDLAATAAAVEGFGGRIHTAVADVRDEAALRQAYEEGTAKLGVPTVVVANAGVAPLTTRPHPDEWRDVIDINLTGVYHTLKVSLPRMIELGRGGSIVLTSSTAGLNGVGGNTPGGLGYTASKHGLVGLMRAYANYLAPYSIRVNTVHPTVVSTDMANNDVMQEFVHSDPSMKQGLGNALPVNRIDAEDIANAVSWLVSDSARYVTGVTLPVDAGFTNIK